MRSRLVSEESGFTLIEVLVVTVVIGILAAIALVMFTGQTEKGHDANAKSNASELVAAVDRCYVEEGDFTQCDGAGAGDHLGITGLPIGSGQGQVRVINSTVDTFKVEADSKAGHHFFIAQGTDGRQVHTCDAGASNNGGGCNNGTWP